MHNAYFWANLTRYENTHKLMYWVATYFLVTDVDEAVSSNANRENCEGVTTEINTSDYPRYTLPRKPLININNLNIVCEDGVLIPSTYYWVKMY